MIATGHLNGKVTLWSQTDKICEVSAHSESCMGLALSPDGRFVTSIGKDGSLAIIDVHMPQTGPVHVLTGFKALSTETSPAVSPDSRIVAVCGSESIVAWEILSGSSIAPIQSKALGVCWAHGQSATSNSNHQLLSVHEDGVVKWWAY
jgi:WD40 repeat protein